jgi:hypothetical protein
MHEGEELYPPHMVFEGAIYISRDRKDEKLIIIISSVEHILKAQYI